MFFSKNKRIFLLRLLHVRILLEDEVGRSFFLKKRLGVVPQKVFSVFFHATARGSPFCVSSTEKVVLIRCGGYSGEDV